MKSLKSLARALWKDESAQGAVEYILLLVVVVAVAMIFRRQITEAVNSRLADISGGMSGFSVNN